MKEQFDFIFKFFKSLVASLIGFLVSFVFLEIYLYFNDLRLSLGTPAETILISTTALVCFVVSVILVYEKDKIRNSIFMLVAFFTSIFIVYGQVQFNKKAFKDVKQNLANRIEFPNNLAKIIYKNDTNDSILQKVYIGESAHNYGIFKDAFLYYASEYNQSNLNGKSAKDIIFLTRSLKH